MENKAYHVRISQKDHFNFLLHEIRFHALLVSLVAFIGFGVYSVIYVVNASPKFDTIAILNIAVNLLIIAAAVAGANLLLLLLCNYVAARRYEQEMRFNEGDFTFSDDAFSYTCSAADYRIKWSAIRHVAVTKKQFIFYVNSGLTVFIPKSSLLAEQAEEIGQLLLSKTAPETVLATPAPETEDEFLDKLFGEDTVEEQVDEVADEADKDSQIE